MYLRQTRHSGLTPANIEETIENIRSAQLPRMSGEFGYAGGLILVDRYAGRVVGMTLWESDAAMRRSEATATQVREAIEATGGNWHQQPAVERYEIAIDTRDAE